MSEYKPYDKEPFIHEIKDKRDWEDTDLKYHRMDIADYLYYINKGQCFYCKMEIDKNITNEHIEHIIDKGDYDQFTYQPKNLTLSCPNCNTAKSTTSVLDNPISTSCNYDEYPYESESYTIVHAYLDEYEQYIKPGIVYEPIDGKEKGIQTIKICGINHYIRVEQRERTAKKEKRYISRLISRIKDSEQVKVSGAKIVEDIFNNLEDEPEVFEYSRGSKILFYLLEELTNDVTRINNGIIVRMKNLNDECICEFNEQYELISTIFNSENKHYIRITINNNQSKYEIYEGIENVLNILGILKSLYEKKIYSNSIRFLLNIDNYPIVDQYVTMNNFLEPDLINSLRYVVEISSTYFMNESKRIDKEKIKKSINICKKIRDIKEEELSRNI